MEEIKVGEYVRTKNGLIGKVNKIEIAGSGVRFGGEFLTDTIIQFNDGKVYERRCKRNQIIKYSKNLIDLIEVGDLLEIELSEEFVEKEDKNVFTRLGDVFTKETLQRNVDNGIVINIKTILTHEQYEENCYKITTNDKLNS